MKVVRGYKTELDLNEKQRTACMKHAGASRFAYNWGLARSKEAYCAIGKRPTAIELHRELNKLKQTEYPWMYKVSKCAPQEALRNLGTAYRNFFRRLALKKAGQFKGKLGFPKFKNHTLAQAVSDSNFGEIRRQLDYKAAWQGTHLVVIDRFYPSSKTCSRCRYIKPELSLSERIYVCEACGMMLDRDLNAAINLRNVAVSSIDTQNACGQKSAGLLDGASETVLGEAGTNQLSGERLSSQRVGNRLSI